MEEDRTDEGAVVATRHHTPSMAEPAVCRQTPEVGAPYPPQVGRRQGDAVTISADNANRGSDVGGSRATRPEPCVPLGAGRPLGLWLKRRTRAGRRARRLYLCRTSKRIRHHPECTWNQTLTDPCAPMSGAGNSGDELGGCRTCSGMAGRNVGGTNSADPVFHPSNGGTHANRSPIDREQFTHPGARRGNRPSVAVRSKPQAKAGQDSPGANGGVWACSVEHFAAPRRAQSRIAKYTRESRIASAAPFAKKS